MARFREGDLHVGIATDVAARGWGIQGVSHVFNYDVPENAEDDVHRVGRTASIGNRGRAFTFVPPEQGNFLTEIEKLINKQIVQPAVKYMSVLLWRNVDDVTIDRGLVDGMGRVAVQLSLFVRVFQNGRVSRYAGYVLFGVIALTGLVALFSIPAVQEAVVHALQKLGA